MKYSDARKFFSCGWEKLGDSIKKVIVIGSTGTIGEAVSTLLLNSGFSVIGIGRKVPSLDEKKENYIHHILDLQNTELLEATLLNIVRKMKRFFVWCIVPGLENFPI